MARSARKHSPAAYTLVDLSSLDDKETLRDILDDAHAGGGQYGIRVVEESVNGGARAPIYGYYNEPNPDAQKWADAKKDLGIEASEVDDSEAYNAAGVGVLEADPRRAAALREAAAQRAAADADRIRSGEIEAVTAITGDEDDDVRTPAAPPATQQSANTVDVTLDPNATNEAADAENTADNESKAKKSKTPR